MAPGQRADGTHGAIGSREGERLMKNIEFKAELRDPELARATCAILKARRVGTLVQTDEYVAVPEGRLKRRTERSADATDGEARVIWIWYDRADRMNARSSRWTPLDDAQVAVRWPGLDRTVVKVIVKRRELWIVENVRIHLDSVAGLGQYFELEGVVGIADDPAETKLKVETLIEKFRPTLGEPVSGSYADL
jgi:adenylate cyclase class IV